MLINVSLAQIDDNPFQRRQDYGDIEELAAHIAANLDDYPYTGGLLQVPLGRLVIRNAAIPDGEIVDREQYQVYSADRRLVDDPAVHVELAFGHRRKRAFDYLASHWEKLNVESAALYAAEWMPINLQPLTDDQMLDAVWSENQHRADINPIEQAELLAEKLDRARAAGGNQQTVAADWGLDRSTIANKIRLLDLPPDVQTALRDRRLSERQALALLPVVELQAKLNGDTPVKWDGGKKPEPYGPPITPAAFLAHAVANPDKATSDAIRDYARAAADHAGRPLPDYLAAFEAGQGENIIQSTCKGCPHRHNQHCLQPTCLNARWDRFKPQIPQLAADHTGLPWCDDPAAFPNDLANARQLRALYEDARRQGEPPSADLVVGWVDAGYKDAWLTGRAGGYQSAGAIRADWRKGLLLGRRPQTQPAPEAEEAEQPPRDDWWRIHREAEERRQARIRQALTSAIDRLLDDRAEQLRPLLYLVGRRSYGYTYHADQSVAAALHQLVNDSILLNCHPYDSWADLFTAIGLDPALLAPADPADDLRGHAAAALIDWARNRGNAPSVISPIAVALGQVINAFEAFGITDDQSGPLSADADLAGLARWLPIAYADAARALNVGKEAK